MAKSTCAWPRVRLVIATQEPSSPFHGLTLDHRGTGKGDSAIAPAPPKSPAAVANRRRRPYFSLGSVIAVLSLRVVTLAARDQRLAFDCLMTVS